VNVFPSFPSPPLSWHRERCKLGQSSGCKRILEHFCRPKATSVDTSFALFLFLELQRERQIFLWGTLLHHNFPCPDVIGGMLIQAFSTPPLSLTTPPIEFIGQLANNRVFYSMYNGVCLGFLQALVASYKLGC